jgi:hypothetical protein
MTGTFKIRRKRWTAGTSLITIAIANVGIESDEQRATRIADIEAKRLIELKDSFHDQA